MHRISIQFNAALHGGYENLTLFGMLGGGGGVLRGACMYVASVGILGPVNMQSHVASPSLCVPIVGEQSFLVAG